MAKDTLAILAKMEYENEENEKVSLKEELAHCLKNTKFYTSEDLQIKTDELEIVPISETKIEIWNTTTVSAILRLSKEEEQTKIMCLNFASAKNPGGGFMNGAEAQEESLARTSALYISQLEVKPFYEIHRTMKSCLYTDAMIYSPKVPVFRNDKGKLLREPVLCNFITAAAVNAGVVMRQESESVSSIETVMDKRMDKMLALALANGNETLILGAWGCGVFKNDPNKIAKLFSKQLKGKYKNAFKRIVFAIYTKNEQLIKTFETI